MVEINKKFSAKGLIKAHKKMEKKMNKCVKRSKSSGYTIPVDLQPNDVSQLLEYIGTQEWKNEMQAYLDEWKKLVKENKDD